MLHCKTYSSLVSSISQVHAFTTSEALSNCMLSYTDVVGILRQFQPIRNFKNKYNQEQSCIRFTINDMQFVLGIFISNFIQRLHVQHFNFFSHLLTVLQQRLHSTTNWLILFIKQSSKLTSIP